MNLPIWKYLPAKWAHSLAPLGLSYYASKMPDEIPEWSPMDWKGLHFPNRLGIAGGVDKNAEHLNIWQKLGVGFIEVGTVTPYSQSANSGKILDRDWESKNLWNRMGFPNHGADEVYFNLMSEKPGLKIPVFVNIGKNRSRPNYEAEIDYLYLADRFQKIADAFVINVSSPNTQGLRDLQTPEFLKKLLKGVKDRVGQKPVLVKLSPDMSDEDFRESIEACAEAGCNGFILTNTTLSRPSNCEFPNEGGLSGLSLAELSKKHLKKAIEILGTKRSEFLLVSVGGVLTADEVKERLRLGADLVQTYSALVFEGPQFFRVTAASMT
ncbi:MAG: quinone-dependent dihydroorotate dehydrogenase [Pseudobdellovibrionaceae bacterium]